MDLPKYFDVIVLGTGLTESIVSAACSRIGKSVLHLDQNNYYGNVYASFTFDQLEDWLNQQKTKIDIKKIISSKVENENLKSKFFKWNDFNEIIYNVEICSYLQENLSDEKQNNVNQDNITQNEENYTDEIDKKQNDENEIKKYTKEDFYKLRKKFNIDLCPRLLYSSGITVELLVSSNISRYLSFKSVTRLLCTKLNSEKLIEVPYSRQSIFLSNEISLIEKRLLMKFIQFCLESDSSQDEISQYNGKPFHELMDHKKLTPFLQKVILNCVAFSQDNDILTEKAIEFLKKFINSTGKYGNTPFLFSVYGSGEMAQAFCRLSAVFGGTYWLDNTIDNVKVIDDEKRDSNKLEVTFHDNLIKCNYLVSGVYSTPKLLINDAKRKYISKAILITNESVFKINDSGQLNKECSLACLNVAFNDKTIYLLELPSTFGVCPEGFYLVYIWCDSSSHSAKEDLSNLVEKLFIDKKNEEIVSNKVLWSCYFNQEFIDCSFNEQIIPYHEITSSPCNELDYDFAILEAKKIFKKIYPNDEFLPRAPDPDEIIFEDTNDEINTKESNIPNQNNEV